MVHRKRKRLTVSLERARLRVIVNQALELLPKANLEKLSSEIRGGMHVGFSERTDHNFIPP